MFIKEAESGVLPILKISNQDTEQEKVQVMGESVN